MDWTVINAISVLKEYNEMKVEMLVKILKRVENFPSTGYDYATEDLFLVKIPGDSCSSTVNNLTDCGFHYTEKDTEECYITYDCLDLEGLCILYQFLEITTKYRTKEG